MESHAAPSAVTQQRVMSRAFAMREAHQRIITAGEAISKHIIRISLSPSYSWNDGEIASQHSSELTSLDMRNRNLLKVKSKVDAVKTMFFSPLIILTQLFAVKHPVEAHGIVRYMYRRTGEAEEQGTNKTLYIYSAC